MPRVICALPNASDEISGVKFTLLDDGRRISEEISDEVAGAFASITGYELDDEGEDAPETPPVQPKAPTLTKAQQKAADKKALADKAVEAPTPEAPAAQESAAEDNAAGDNDAPEAPDADDAGETDKPAEVF